MNLQEIPLKCLSVETDGSTLNLEQIEKCFLSMKEGGIIYYQLKHYTYALFAELLCSLHQNGDITDKVLSDAYHSHCPELMEIERRKSELEKMSEFRQYIANVVKEDNR